MASNNGVVIGDLSIVAKYLLFDETPEFRESFLKHAEVIVNEQLSLRMVHTACINGHTDLVKLLIKHKCNLEYGANFGVKPLHYACVHGRTDIVRLLIENNCDIECEDINGAKPLHYACGNGQIDVVKLLIEKKCNIDCTDIRGFRPIYDAVVKDHTEVAKLLIENNCDIECEYVDGNKIIHYASAHGRNEVIKLLIEKKCSLESSDKKGQTPILLAYLNKRTDTMRLLLDNNCSTDHMDEHGFKLLHYVCLLRNIDVLKLLIEYKCNIECENKDGNTPLHMACICGDIDIARLLIENNCNIDCENNIKWRPIHFACSKMYFDIVKLLIDNNCSVKIDPEVDLPKKPNVEKTETKVNPPCESEILDETEINPLHCTILDGCVERCEQLLKDGAKWSQYADFTIYSSSDPKDLSGLDAIWSLSSRENALTLCLKVNKTVYPCLLEKLNSETSNSCDESENSLLHLAALSLQPQISKSLIQAGALINKLNKKGNNCLLELLMNVDHLVRKDNMDQVIETVNVLVDSGVDIRASAPDGRSALQCAARLNNNEKLLQALLKKHLEHVDKGSLKPFFSEKGFNYKEVLMQYFHKNPLPFNLSSEVKEICLNCVESNEIESLFEKSEKNVKQSILPDLLYLAAKKEDEKLFDFLLTTEVLVPKLFPDGESILTTLLKEKRIRYCWKLIQSAVGKSYISFPNKDEQTPLHIAIEMEEMDIVNSLIVELDEINPEDKRGQTPLKQLIDKTEAHRDVEMRSKLFSAIKTIIRLNDEKESESPTIGHILSPKVRVSVRRNLNEFYERHMKNTRTLPKVAEIDPKICSICMDKCISEAFNCGHTLCSDCSDLLTTCPICKAELTGRRKIYL